MSDRRTLRGIGLIAALGLSLGGAATVMALAQEDAASVEVLGEPAGADAIRLGQQVYAANCASCHGVKLEGQPDWKRRLDNGRMPAPPHDASGHTWHHADQDLLTITRDGLAAIVPGYESDMPAFGGTLSEEEIRAVLAYIKSTWPERERAFQAEVTRSKAVEGDGS